MQRRKFSLIFIFALLLMFAACTQNSAVQTTPNATPAETFPVDTPVQNDSILSLLSSEIAEDPRGQITGTVISLQKNGLVVNVGRTTFVFQLTLIPEIVDQIKPGDIVTVHYVGDTALSPEATAVIVNGSSSYTTAISGVILKNHGWYMNIQTITGNIYGFSLTEDTVYQGFNSAKAKIGDTVMVTYNGELVDLPIALDVSLLSPADEGPLSNRTIKGKVTALSADSITILAADGNSFTFRINDNTEKSGDYELTVGATVRITFDGYAAKSPLAKHISVLLPVPTPTPRPTPTPSPTKSPKATATPKCSPSKSPTPSPSRTVTPSPTPVITTTPVTPSPTPTPTPTPIISDGQVT